MMFCTQCGTQLADTARFCTTCGKNTSAPVDPLTVPAMPAQPAHQQAIPRRLHRILAGKKFAGVCNGYAEYFDMDVTLMRLIWLALILIPPQIGLFAYFISWAVLPKI